MAIEPTPAITIPDDLFEPEITPAAIATNEVLPIEGAAPSPQPPAPAAAKPAPPPPPSRTHPSGSEQDALNLILKVAGIDKLEIPPEQSHETLLLIGGLMR